MRPIGIDLSKYDKVFTPETAEIKPDFVIQRVGYGLVRDELFDVIFKGVSQFDLRLGYHYLNSGIDYKQQADKYLEYSNGCGFQAHVSDFEGFANTLSVDFAYQCWKWIDYVRQRTGKEVFLYTGKYLYQEFIEPSSKKYGINWNSVPLWIAQYNNKDPQTASPDLPIGRTSGWDIWQFSSTGNGTLFGTGRTDKIDQNVFNGTLNDFRIRLGLGPVGGSENMIYTGTVLVGGLRIRSGAGTTYTILGFLNAGDVVTASEVQSGWWKITSINGTPFTNNGWAFCGDSTKVSGEYIKLTSTSGNPPSGEALPAYIIGYDQNGTQIARWDLVK